MNPLHLSLLACPETGEPLDLILQETNGVGQVLQGLLVTRCGREYPIVRGVPRFVSQERYAGSFGFEWNRWPRVQFEQENVGRRMAGHTTRMWETITALESRSLHGQTVIEFGCGPGRFLDVVRRKQGCAVGLDMSLAVEAARQNFANDPHVLIVQADILKPPFRAGVFDGGYSIGVLHHTPAPADGLTQLVKCVKPGGWTAVCVYPKGEFYDYPSVARYRRWHRVLSRRWGYRPALAYSYLAAYGLAPALRKLRKLPGGKRLRNWLEREWLVSLDLPDPRWRVLDVFDAITPETASTHTAEELQGWLASAGCANIRPTPWCSTSFVAECRSRSTAQMHAA